MILLQLSSDVLTNAHKLKQFLTSFVNIIDIEPFATYPGFAKEFEVQQHQVLSTKGE